MPISRLTCESAMVKTSKSDHRDDPTSRPTPEDRVVTGKAARATAPLESHAEFRPAKSRDPVALLLGQAETRVPELVPIRHGRMLVSPFTFYRGAALVMAADLDNHPDVGLAKPAVRRRAPVEFRCVRLAGTAPGLRHQRLRRDNARPTRMGCQAAGRQSRRGGTGQRLHEEAMPQGHPGQRGELPNGDASLPHGQTILAVWYAHLNIEEALAKLQVWPDTQQGPVEEGRGRHQVDRGLDSRRRTLATVCRRPQSSPP